MEEPILQFFEYLHVRPDQENLQKFHEMATWIVATYPRNPERTVALRKLLEAKDCFVRASLES